MKYENVSVNFDGWAALITEYVEYRQAAWWKLPFNKQDWEDIRQDVMLHIWERRHTCDPLRSPRPWIKTVVYRHILNAIRSRFLRYNRMPFQSLIVKFDEENGAVYEPDGIDNMSLRPKMTQEDFERELSPIELKVFHMFLEDMSVKDIAKELKFSLAYIYQIKHKLERKYSAIV